MNSHTTRAYDHLKNQTVSWLPMDTKELFLEHQSNDDTRKALKKLNWTEDNVKYKFNSQGFRSDDFNSKGDSIVFLGCSHTIGIGINFEDTASYIVSRQLGYNCFNLGMAGGSNDTCFRFAYHWIEKLHPKIVVIMAPDVNRVEIAYNSARDFKKMELAESEDEIAYNSISGTGCKRVDKAKLLYKNLNPANSVPSVAASEGMTFSMPKEFESFYRIWISEHQNSHFNFHKNILAIEQICYKNDAKFVYTNSDFQCRPWPLAKKSLYARDLAHAGKIPNQLKSEEILDLINCFVPGRNNYYGRGFGRSTWFRDVSP
jgi:hypothetical protein